MASAIDEDLKMEQPPQWGDPIDDEDLGNPEALNDGVEAALGLQIEDDEPAPPDEPPPEPEAAETETETEAEAEAEAETETLDPEAAEAQQPETAAAEAPETTETEPDPRDIRIPKSRLDKEIKARRELEAQVAEYRRKHATGEGTAPAFELPDTEAMSTRTQAMWGQVLDGNFEEATSAFNQLMSEVGAHAAKTALDQIDDRVDSRVYQSTNQTAFDTAVDEIEARYPALAADHPDFDPDLTADVLAIQESYVSRGKSPAEALRQAVKLTALEQGWAIGDEPAAPPAADPAKATAAKAAQKATATQRNVAAATAQPPIIGGTVEQPETIDIRKLSDEEYNALPAATRARMRGDVF